MLESKTTPVRGPDAELLRLLRARDPEGLRGLLAEHGPRVQGGLCREFRNVLDQAHIEEAISLAAHHTWRAARKIDLRRGSLRAWFYATARNCALRVLRRERRERQFTLVTNWEQATVQAMEFEPLREPSSEQIQADEAFLADLRLAIDALAPVQREIIEADLEAGGLADSAELAKSLQCSINSIYSQRFMARRALRMALVKRGHFKQFTDDPPTGKSGGGES